MIASSTAIIRIWCTLQLLQVSELGVWASERSSAAAAARAAVAAESSAQKLLAELKSADAEAQEKLQDLLKCISDAAAQVRGVDYLQNGLTVFDQRQTLAADNPGGMNFSCILLLTAADETEKDAQDTVRNLCKPRTA